MSDALPPVGVQNNVINSSVDASLLDIFLLGIYTTIYVGTMYIYLASKKSRSLFVLSSITILYLMNVGQTAVDWFLIRQLVGLAGETKETFYIFASFSPGWSILTSDIFSFILSTVADALLIWRCYHAWDGSLRIIAVSLVLLIAEAALYISLITCAVVTRLHPPPATAVIMNDLLGAALFTSLGSTLVTTFLIIYRIRSVSRNSPVPMYSQRRYSGVLDLLVQSAAVYAIASLVNAILTVITFNNLNPRSALAISIGQYFIDSIFPITAGLAPTVMVARVALASSTTSTDSFTAKMSKLNFQGVDTASMSHATNFQSSVVEGNGTLSQRDENGLQAKHGKGM